MKIIKLQNKNVILTDDSDVFVQQLPGNSTNIEIGGFDTSVKISFEGYSVELITSEVTATRIEPAAEIPFVGTSADLADLLSESFFFKIVGSGGGGGDASASNQLIQISELQNQTLILSEIKESLLNQDEILSKNQLIMDNILKIIKTQQLFINQILTS
jgi:hypothetical protein